MESSVLERSRKARGCDGRGLCPMVPAQRPLASGLQRLLPAGATMSTVPVDNNVENPP
jgi:hypothetical protein